MSTRVNEAFGEGDATYAEVWALSEGGLSRSFTRIQVARNECESVPEADLSGWWGAGEQSQCY
ncbi:MAG: hypothetical protein AAF493_30435 [Pseudomonadota bacterium]